MITILLVIGILMLLIIAHEFGHFIAAKGFGVKVEEFGVGYPPRALSFGKWKGTEYTLNWIPFGGFVRLFGDEGQGIKGRGSMVDAHRAVQAMILVAGVAANVVVAWLLFAIALHIGIPHEVAPTDSQAGARLMIAQVLPGSPAEAAGLSAGDVITAVSDSKGSSVGSVTAQNVISFVKARAGEAMSVYYLHAGALRKVSIIAAHGVVPGASDQPALGVELVAVRIVSLPWPQALVQAFAGTKNAISSAWGGLVSIVQNLATGSSALSDVVGPVGLVGVVGEVAQNGLGNVLSLTAFISINLAIINLIPIPALDGGRLLVLAIEAAARRSAPRVAVQLLNTFGIALIIFLMVTVTYHDITRLLA